MVKIYKLIDPNTLEIRYIGKTIQTIKKRLSAHITRTKQERVYHVNCWIYSLLLRNQKPIIELIENCEDTLWEEREKYWIQYYGIDNLCNHSLGGENGSNMPLTEEHKKKISDTLKGCHRPEEVKKKISEAHKGKVLKQSTKDKLRDINLGKKYSLEVCIKKSKGKILQFDLQCKLLLNN